MPNVHLLNSLVGYRLIEAQTASQLTAAAARSQNGDTILLLPGSYTLTGTLTLPQGVNLLGYGQGVSIINNEQTSGSAARVITAEGDNVISSLSILGSLAITDGTAGQCVYYDGPGEARDVLVQDCALRASKALMEIEDPDGGVFSMIDCTISGLRRNAMLVNANTAANTDVCDIRFIGNSFSGNWEGSSVATVDGMVYLGTTHARVMMAFNTLSVARTSGYTNHPCFLHLPASAHVDVDATLHGNAVTWGSGFSTNKYGVYNLSAAPSDCGWVRVLNSNSWTGYTDIINSADTYFKVELPNGVADTEHTLTGDPNSYYFDVASRDA